MNVYQIRAFLRKFRFLEEMVKEYDPTTLELTVERVDASLLERTPGMCRIDQCVRKCYSHRSYFLYSEEGLLLGKVKGWREQLIAGSWWPLRLSKIKEIPAETVGECMVSFAEAGASIHFVVRLTIPKKDSSHQHKFSICVYKPPHGYALNAWLSELDRRERETLDAKITALDDEGKT